jgi:two-component system copper resistance phosphate regulon response regulator CusR
LTPKILVAEDDTALNALVVAWLRKGGLQAESVFDGEAAIEQLRITDYAAILLDIMMPRATGFDVIEFVKAERPEMLGRIVVMTAGGESIVARLRADSIYRLLEKPFDLREVLNTLRECAARFQRDRPESREKHGLLPQRRATAD